MLEYLKLFRNDIDSKQETLIRLSLWLMRSHYNQPRANITFSVQNLIRENSIDVKIVNSLEYVKQGLSLDHILHYNELLLDGWKSNIFFVDYDNKYITPKLLHPWITPFPLDSNVTRDSLMVIEKQKIFGNRVIEKDIKINDINNKDVFYF